MTTNRQNVFFPLFLFACFAAPSAAVVAADLPHKHGDPPAVVSQALVDAQAATAAGDSAAALAHVARGLAGVAAVGRARYQQARLEQWAVQWREREVLRLIDAGDAEAARVVLAQWSEPLRSDYAERRRAELERRVEAMAEGPAGTSAELRWVERRLAAASKLLERADRELDRSRSNSRRTVTSARHAEVALRRFRAAERELMRLDRAGHGEAAVALRDRAVAGGIAAMLQLADAKTIQGDFRSALSWIDEVQLQEPDNRRAAELRTTVQIAAAAATAWFGWPVVGGVAR